MNHLKDLKHLYEFEKLLESANNALVQQACAGGMHAVGYTCYHMPEVLLNTGNCFSVRLRAPLTGSLDISSYYMSNFICDYCKSILERGIEGGYNFLSAIMGTETCSEMNRALEHFELIRIVENDPFFVTFIDMPFKVAEHTVRHYVEQLQLKVLNPLHEVYGTDISDDALRQAVAEHNEVCRILTEIGELRKLDIPPITGYEFAVLVLVSYTCPKRLILPLLRETLEEIRTRQVDSEKNYRVRVAVVGSEIDDPNLIGLIESCGALVVADRFCYGSFPGRQEIALSEQEDALTQVCRWYLQNTECPRQSALHRVKYRNDHVAQLVRDFRADGAIYEQMKFCTYWSYERVIANQIMPRDYGIQVLSIDRPYIVGQSGQLRTRVQAFVESIEMKKLRAARKEEK